MPKFKSFEEAAKVEKLLNEVNGLRMTPDEKEKCRKVALQLDSLVKYWNLVCGEYHGTFGTFCAKVVLLSYKTKNGSGG